MADPRAVNSRLEGLRNKAPVDRFATLCGAAGVEESDLRELTGKSALPLSSADGMIENVIGTFELPLGVATNFTVNGRDYLVPMAVEEPSVVAAASFMARIARDNGGFSACRGTAVK